MNIKMRGNIINFVVLVLIITILAGCNLSKPKKLNTVINGSWKENWGAGAETNVDYSDVYIINTDSKGKITISCPTRKNYQFEKISFDKKTLKTKLVIKDLKYNAGDAWVEYVLELQEDNAIFKGKALTQAGKNVEIIWDRVLSK
jgi:hypothetical protein